jgi:FtsP/CotA-like multicopper oxidase with cupredoxin domain
VHPKNWSSWILRLVALVCLTCALSIPSVGAQTVAGDAAASSSISVSAKGHGASDNDWHKEAEGETSAKSSADAASKNAASPDGGCFRAAVGSEVPEPEDLRSIDGVLKVDLAFRSFVDSKGEVRFCYVTPNGKQSPTLRVKPGDTVILNFKNEATATLPQTRTVKAAQRAGASAPDASAHSTMQMNSGSTPAAPCATAPMKATSTNLHFHGLTVPAACHQDDVMRTMIETGSAPYEYKFQIPADEPPGLYWYHPHIHGFTKAQVLGGASAALVVEGIERAIPSIAGLPERVLIVRDQNLANPDAAPTEDAKLPPVKLDADGDVMNTGTGTGKPAEDLTLNYVPVPYPDYQPAKITMKPGERQLWRVLNASAITYLSLQLLYDDVAQAVDVVALDGVPIHNKDLPLSHSIRLNHLGVPPGGRIEFVVEGPAAGSKASLVTRGVNTGAMGENDPTRAIAEVVAKADAPEPQSSLAKNPTPLPERTTTWLRDVTPVRVRKLFFSETPLDPKDPNSPTTFYLTLDGETPKAFDPSSGIPNIVTHQGDVEDWILENRSQELHAFHIHQVHFALMEFFGLPVNEPFLRDTVNVPYWDGKNPVYPRVRLRMDFRDPNAVGTYPYHCHLLEHEDSGMMGLIRVEAAGSR